MKEWMNEWKNEWMNERMKMNEWKNENEWMKEWKWKNERMKEWKNERMKMNEWKWMNERMKMKEWKWMNERMKMNEWKNENEWMKEWKNERKNEWMNESVCVWTIWRDVKVLTCWNSGALFLVLISFYYFSVSQGAAAIVIVLQPRRRLTAMTFCDIDLGRWINVPAIQIFFQCGLRLRHSNWLSSEPASRIFTQFLPINWFQLFVVRVGACWRNSLAMAVAASQCFSGPFNDPFARCIPQRNSQWQLTLSKCVTHVGSTRCREPFGEYLAR